MFGRVAHVFTEYVVANVYTIRYHNVTIPKTYDAAVLKFQKHVDVVRSRIEPTFGTPVIPTNRTARNATCLLYRSSKIA